MEKYIVLFAGSIDNFKTLKYHKSSKKALVVPLVCSQCGNGDETKFKEQESIFKKEFRYLEFLV